MISVSGLIYPIMLLLLLLMLLLLLCFICLLFLNCAPNWQTEQELGHGQWLVFNYPECGGGKSGSRQCLIESSDPAQSLRIRWRQMSKLNYSVASEHWGHEQWGSAWGRAQVTKKGSGAYARSHAHRGAGRRVRFIWGRGYLVIYLPLGQ